MASSTSSEPPDELATAVGRYVLGEISLGKAAEAAGMSRWEFEEVLRDAGFEALYGPRTDEQLEEELDAARNLGE
jgi:predicted HTH domain antitoxin